MDCHRSVTSKKIYFYCSEDKFDHKTHEITFDRILTKNKTKQKETKNNTDRDEYL